MIPTDLEISHKHNVIAHAALLIKTSLSNEEIIEKIIEQGVTSFVTPDSTKYINDYIGRRVEVKYFVKNKIDSIESKFMASCCAFSKNIQKYFLYPITKKELENVGLVEEDLIQWLSFLEGLDIGLKYSYYGKHNLNNSLISSYNTHINNAYDSNENRDAVRFRYDDHEDKNEVYWVGVNKMDNAVKTASPHDIWEFPMNLTYFHWICLRYLINTTTAPWNFDNEEIEKVPYYFIPRITMLLVNRGLPHFKAFKYAHVAGPFYSYYSLFNSDGLLNNAGKDLDISTFNVENKPAPDLSVTEEEFKKILNYKSSSLSDVMFNNYFTSKNNWAEKVIGRSFCDQHDAESVIGYFQKGMIDKFIDKLDSFYDSKHVEETEKEDVEKTVKKKNIRKTAKLKG